MKKLISNIPNAEILIHSMRSIGYDFETALADLIDNSITAKAKNIDLYYQTNSNEELFLQLIDDGVGMSRQELIEAMRFGTEKTIRSKDDLGRFGLGLKTASISQARRFTVTSKKNDQISSFTWDLDEIKIHSDWKMIENSKDEFKSNNFYSKVEHLNSFTIVHWEKIDKLDNEISIFKNLFDIFLGHITRSEKHISLTFHRFLEKNLDIRFNNNKIIPIDPFLTRHPKTIFKEEQFITTKTSEGNKEKVLFQMYVLPYHKDLNQKDYDTLGGLEKLDDQGFYVYRNKRLMISGTWFGIKTRKDLFSNARIRVDIPNSLDDLWSIDVKKQRAKIPAVVLEQLKGEVSDAVERSRKIHIYKGESQIKGDSIWTKVIDKRENKVRYTINKESIFLKNITDKLEDNQVEHINRALEMIEMSIPYKDIYNSVAEKKDINSFDDDSSEILINLGFKYFQEIKSKKNWSKEKIIDYICQYEPFAKSNIKLLLLEKLQ
jgi:hypothetical protein